MKLHIYLKSCESEIIFSYLWFATSEQRSTEFCQIFDGYRPEVQEVTRRHEKEDFTLVRLIHGFCFSFIHNKILDFARTFQIKSTSQMDREPGHVHVTPCSVRATPFFLRRS